MKGRAYIKLSEEVLMKALNLPDTVCITGIVYRTQYNTWDMYLRGKNLPEPICEGAGSPCIELQDVK